MAEMEMRIGGEEFFITVSDRFAEIIGKTYRRLNYKRRIARMRHGNIGEVDTPCVVIDSDFLFALEDTLDEDGYGDAFHRQFAAFDMDTRKVLYEIFREDKTIRYLVAVRGLKRSNIESAIFMLFNLVSDEVK